MSANELQGLGDAVIAPADTGSAIDSFLTSAVTAYDSTITQNNLGVPLAILAAFLVLSNL